MSNLNLTLLEQVEKDLVLLDAKRMVSDIVELYERIENIRIDNRYFNTYVCIDDSSVVSFDDYHQAEHKFKFYMNRDKISLKVYLVDSNSDILIDFSTNDFREFNSSKITGYKHRVLYITIKKIYNELPSKIEKLKIIFPF